MVNYMHTKPDIMLYVTEVKLLPDDCISEL